MTSSLHGKFVWYELATPDLDAAERFYGAVLGWSARDGGVPGMRYSMVSIGGVDIGGMMAQESGMPAAWTGYVAVDDIEATVARLHKSGGKTMMPISPIPNVGRFTVAADPQGASFALLEYAPDFPKPDLPAEGLQGHGWWRELHSTDEDAALAFYADLFGWTEVDRMQGPLGAYRIIGGDLPMGGLLKAGDGKPRWLFYFWVADIDATLAALRSNGGKASGDPQEVPGGAWIIHATDPQGIAFALVGERKK